MSDDLLFPPGLPVTTAMGRTASGRAWLHELPGLVAGLSSRWELQPGAPYRGGSCSWVAPAQRRDGSRAVLKVTWPHREARFEGAVLRLWAGRGAVRVYEHDAAQYALLLERCEPGTELGAASDIDAEERLLLGAGVLRRLWDAGRHLGRGGSRTGRAEGPGAPGVPDEPPRAAAAAGRTGSAGGPGAGAPGTAVPPGTPGTPASAEPAVPEGLERLSDVAAEWADLVEERAARHRWPAGTDTGLLARGASLLRELPPGARQETVVHGDFNPGNLLAAGREPWLAIDAKPMYGDAAFDPWPLIQQIDDPFAHPAPHRVLARRTALVADALGEDVDRVRAWAVARLVDQLLWSTDLDGEVSGSLPLIRQVRTLADVAGL